MNKHGKRKKLEKQKKKKQKQRKQHKKKQDLARRRSLPYFPEEIVCNILSRLPVQSLMRFKCVCSQWQSLIEEDQSFIDLNFSRSKTALLRMGELKRIQCMMSMELFFSSEEEDVEAAGDMSLWDYPFPENYWNCFFHTTNGLLCVLDPFNYRVGVYNISTGESTQWVQSTFLVQQQELEEHLCFSLNMFGLGYDPVTMEHKVIALWSYWETNELVCEVLTVGQNTWRGICIVDLPPLCVMEYCSHSHVESVHVNGFIYWLDLHRDCRDPCLIQFQVGSEKFRKMNILFPDKIGNFWYDKLIHIDGQLAILTTRESSIKMCILYVQDKESICDYYGMVETFLKPPFDCKEELSHRHEYIPVPGTDLFMVRCKDDKKSFDYYNWKKKSYGSCKIPLGSFEYIQDVIFTPSLFPVN